MGYDTVLPQSPEFSVRHCQAPSDGATSPGRARAGYRFPVQYIPLTTLSCGQPLKKHSQVTLSLGMSVLP